MFSGTSDETNVTLFSSSSPAQMHRKTNDQTGNDLEVLLVRAMRLTVFG